MANIYSKKAVIISPCILSPGLQAEPVYTHDYVHWGNDFIKIIMENNIDIFLLPCAESSFQGYDVGLNRRKHGIDYYLSLEGFSKHCENLAISYAKEILLLRNAGYDFLALLGIEHSPTCAISYLYSHNGTLKREGIFISALNKALNNNGITILNIGINRKYPNKALSALSKIIFN